MKQTQTTGQATRPGFFIPFVYACFFFSGAAGLVYEVVWSRQLGLFLGVTNFAHTAVITAYMAGLAAGSIYFGRRSDRTAQPLKLYAWLEIGVGLYAAFTPWLFTFLQSGYTNLAGVTGVEGAAGHAVRFVIALLALLLPTFLMGGTLPLLVRGVIQNLPHLGRITSRLYGINTLGAMLGTLFAGYVFLPGVGVIATIYIGVVINLGIAIWVLRLLQNPAWQAAPVIADAVTTDSAPEQMAEQPAGQRSFRLVVLAGFAAAGFASLLTQMAWIRAMILLVGGSVYAFTIALACFLAGIGLGSLAYGHFFSSGAVRSRTRLFEAGSVAAVIGFALLLGLPLLAKLPEWYLGGYSAGLMDRFGSLQLFIFLLVAIVMVVPTLFMGILFPLMAVVWTRKFAIAGRGVGAAYAINTAGTILGTLAGGLLLLPWLGIQNSIILSGGIYLLVAIMFWLRGSTRITRTAKLAISLGSLLVYVLVSWLLPGWDRAIWGNGVYYRPEAVIAGLEESSLHEVMSIAEILYYKEGLDGTVVVSADEEQRYLVINGKTDASSKGDLETQILIGQLPALMHQNPRNALVIGLGSGVTVNAVASHASIETVTVLEISGEVVEASAWFNDVNGNVLQNPKVSLHTADARNYVMASDDRWDLIVSEPSNPWVSGVSNLFTTDFFELAKSRLAPGGIMLQWFHTYSMSTDNLKSVLHSFKRSFEHVTVWNVQFGDLLILGSDDPYTLDVDKVERLLADSAVGRDLERAEVLSPRGLVRKYLIGEQDLDFYLRGARINSDNRPVVEFGAPKNFYASTTQSNLNDIVRYLNNEPRAVPVTGLAWSMPGGIDLHYMDMQLQFSAADEVRGVDAAWIVWRDLLKSNGSDVFGVGSSRQVSWQRGDKSERLQAIWQIERQPQKDIDQLLGDSLSSIPLRSGDINMHGDPYGRWMMAAQQGRFEIVIIWACPADREGFMRYAAYSQQPDPGEAAWGDELVALAGQFNCYRHRATEP